MAKSTRKSNIFLLTEKVDRLEKRLAVLGDLLIKPDERNGIVDLSLSRYKLFSEDESDAVESVPVTSKRGRPPLIPRDQLKRQRDDLINFIEPRWPDLVKHMKRPRSEI